MDNVFVRTAADLEKKYNLSKLANSVGNIETQSNQIIHIQNEINDIKKTLIINLGDTLQESVSLWFYEGVPTTANKPYTDWVTPSDHIDDFYYDQLTGYVYKYTSNGWERQYDTSLISALALTNAELDTSLDHERQVFLTQPAPPYQSGDWWILEDGTLMICQIGKNSGVYEGQDFVVSTLYTTTIATKQDDTIEVLKGQVLQITEDYVKYTDLSTGGSTTINGSNITTGVIKSTNYIADTSGTKITLSDGTIDSKNFKLNNVGKVSCKDISIEDGHINVVGGTDATPNFEIVSSGSGYPNKKVYGVPGYLHCLKNVNANTTSGVIITSDNYGGNYDATAIALYTETGSRKFAVYISAEGSKGYIKLYSNGSSTIDLDGETGNITCVSLTQTSQAEKKKNFEEFNNALDIIKNIDIYKYNLKEENDDDKKHIGFVIGDGFNYSKEVTSKDNTGADIYSFVALCCQAIKEQQKQIDELREELRKER